MTSKFHWSYFPIALILFITAFGSLTLVIKNDSESPDIFIEYFFCFAFTSSIVYNLIKFIIETKVISISEKFIRLKYTFTSKEIIYNLEDIVGYKVHKKSTRSGYYRIMQIITSDKKVLSFRDDEYSNYIELSRAIIKKIPMARINEYYNWKKQLIFIFISVIASNILIIATQLLCK